MQIPVLAKAPAILLLVPIKAAFLTGLMKKLIIEYITE